MTSDPEREQLDRWIAILSDLVGQARSWAEKRDWSTRRIEKKIEDSRAGAYTAPALLLQKETTRILLEPIGRLSEGADGIVDLYVMPAWDDVARLICQDGRWLVHDLSPGSSPGADEGEVDLFPLTEASFLGLLEAMASNAA